ncbi:hypothetical protein [Pantanalinema sp. GBBB05]|uniref:hypothetical protein n=1 Tax=Pantanalinema sp. GBBB05 TaxID=2604139 RepID=UPI003D812E1C
MIGGFIDADGSRQLQGKSLLIVNSMSGSLNVLSITDWRGAVQKIRAAVNR